MGFSRAIEEMGKIGKVMLIGNASPLSRADAWKAGTLTHNCFWYPGYSAAAAYEVALRVIEGKEIKTGDNLGVPGFESITVDGNNVYGSGWIDVTAENWEQIADEYQM
jgi:simple sugar transport system substrate-binding protein